MEITAWLTQVCAELGLHDLELDDDTRHTVLDLARDAAHRVERPAAPLTTFLVGVAVGRGQALDAAAETVTTLAARAAPPDLPPDPKTDDDPDPSA
jgi:Domain of unknown function (DUF6457)